MPRAILKLFVLAMLTVALAQSARSQSGGRPEWLPLARAKAEAAGYRLIDPVELETWLREGSGDFLLLDVRPDYEYRAGRLAGAANLEFHLGHEHQFDAEQEKALKAVIGPDKGRPVVIYCRNYQ